MLCIQKWPFCEAQQHPLSKAKRAVVHCGWGAAACIEWGLQAIAWSSHCLWAAVLPPESRGQAWPC